MSSALFTNDELTRVMRSKDVALSRIMEDHEMEMENLACGIEELRHAESMMRHALIRRRGMVRVFGMMFVCIVIGITYTMESRRRTYLERELALDAETERASDRRIISSLYENKKELEGVLVVLGGKMRYQASRNADAEALTRELEVRINDLDRKMLRDMAEYERCHVQGIEMGADIEIELSTKDTIEEELYWCHGRLRSREGGMVIDSSGGALDHHAEVNRDADVKTKGEGLSFDVVATETGEGRRRGGPVYLEMKYNKSVRDAMYVRQAYSALAGLGVTVLLRGIFPPIVGWLLGRSKIAVIMPTPPVAPVVGVEMAIVDGIFGSSIAFLLIRAVALFLMP
jgi:hypothetical protein